MHAHVLRRVAAVGLVGGLAVGLAAAQVVDGPGTIAWKGVTWTVDDNATAEVDVNGNLQISVGGDDGDPVADNWLVHTDVTGLFTSADYEAGAWVEFTFIDNGLQPDGSGGWSYGGGPRAFLDTNEEAADGDAGSREYMFQGGMYDGFSDYYVNTAVYDTTLATNPGYVPGDYNSGFGSDNRFFPGARATGVHSFRAVLTTTTDAVDLYFDGVYMGTVSGYDTPTFFETAFLGVTSNGLNPGGPGYGVYTDFAWGVIPEPTSLALLGFVGLAALRRR